MNVRAAILLSAGLNAALTAVLVLFPSPTSAPTAAAAAVSAAPAPSLAPAATARRKLVRTSAASSPSPAPASAPGEAFHWRQIESNDYRRYIANLRAIGCPEQIIRDLIIADVNNLYAPRLRALHHTAEDRKYWQAEPRWPSLQDMEREKQTDAIRKEKQALIKELLGVEFDEGDQWRTANGWQSAGSVLSFLPPEKISAIRAVEEKFNALAGEIDRRTRNLTEPDDERATLQLRLQQREEMAKLLTPQELEEYELRTSDTASGMRWEMREFSPTEAEFRNVFRLRDEAARSGLLIEDTAASAEEKARYAEAVKQLQASIKLTLGDTRYTTYQRSQDYEFQQLARASERYELPKETASQVWDLRDAADQQAKALNTNQSLTPEQRQAALQAIRTETQNSVKTLLGERAWKGYSPRSNNWLQRLGSLPSEP